MDESSRRVDRPATGVTHARQQWAVPSAGTTGVEWANLTVRALSVALPDLSVDTVLATYPHSDPH